MSNFAYLLISGVAWLGVVTISPALGMEPQWVSLLRGAYLGMFSIALIVELRQLNRAEPSGGTRTWFYFIPILSVVFYNLLGSANTIHWSLAAIFCCFFVAQMAMLRIRERMGQMRQGLWELLPPVLLLGSIVAGPYLWPVSIILLGMMIASDLRQDTRVSPSSLDAVIMQLPSFCLAPVVLVLARDALGLSQDVSRASLEVMGLVINGAGGALWTAAAMRGGDRLARYSVVLWLLGAASAVVALMFHHFGVMTLIQTVVLLGTLELLRGALWLLTTHFLTYMTRWRGALVNLGATLLPLAGAVAMRSRNLDGAGAMIYALFVLPLFLLLLMEFRRRRKAAGPSVEA